MNMHNPTSGNAPGLPADAQNRLAIFAAATRTTAPAKLTEDQGIGETFSDELLTYCQKTGLSLDWLVFGTTAIPEPRPVVPGITPLTHAEVRKERDRLDSIVTQAEGLVHALQILLWDFGAVQLDDKDARDKRLAINAIGDGLERAFARLDEGAA